MLRSVIYQVMQREHGLSLRAPIKYVLGSKLQVSQLFFVQFGESRLTQTCPGKAINLKFTGRYRTLWTSLIRNH